MCINHSTRYRAAEGDTIEFEDIITAENRAVSMYNLQYPLTPSSTQQVGIVAVIICTLYMYIHILWVCSLDGNEQNMCVATNGFGASTNSNIVCSKHNTQKVCFL